jgi:hypothetical protein
MKKVSGVNVSLARGSSGVIGLFYFARGSSDVIGLFYVARARSKDRSRVLVVLVVGDLVTLVVVSSFS